MNHWKRFSLCALFAAALVLPAAPVRAQEPEKQKPADEKERKKREKNRKNELLFEHKQWLDEVGYIISPEERAAFLRLSTNEEREQFIEIIWRGFDPTPDTEENEFREEHYRRIAYANEHFSSGIPGWKTDRGRIYIIWGPPDELESHPGGPYVRPYEEGGGQTSVHPFERWRYRHMEGVGDDIVLEFVDRTNSGEFRQEMDPSTKDALAEVPNAGLSDCEAMGIYTKAERFMRGDGTRLPRTLSGVLPESMNQFRRLEVYAGSQRPPALRFKGLDEDVTIRLVRNTLDFQHREDFLRVAGDTVLVPITIQVPNREMSFQERNGVHVATVNVFWRVTTLTGRRIHVLEDAISREIPASLLQTSLKGNSIYQRAVPLRPGRYRLDIVLKDVNSGNVGVINTVLPVPRFEDQKLATSTMILADQIEPVSTKNVGSGQFVIGATRVRPRMDGDFTTDERLGIFMQVYNLTDDPATGKPSASVEYRVLRGDAEVLLETEAAPGAPSMGQQLTLEKFLPLERFAPGRYKLEVRVTDHSTGQSMTSSAFFTVKPAEKTAAK